MTACAITVAALLLAAEPPAPSPQQLSADAAITSISATAWLALYVTHPVIARTPCPCQPRQVPVFERFAVQFDATSAGIWADALAGFLVVTPPLLLTITSPDLRTFVGDALVVSESVATTGLLTQVAKTGFSRPYPFMYGRGVQPSQNHDGNNYASFWSGHTAVTMAAVVSFAYVLGKRHPDRWWSTLAWLLGPPLAIAAGALEMAAGNHFPSDVVAGAVVGAADGWLTARLHF